MPDLEESLEQSRNARARRAAQAAAERVDVQPTGVVRYQSRGRVVVIGGAEAQWLATGLQPPLHAEVLALTDSDESGVPSTAVAHRTLHVDGHLGAFRVELGEVGRHNHQLIEADMIVDLGEVPQIERELPPPGYWHFGCEPADLDAARLALEGMVGTFEKPRYFDYDPAVCAHARAGQPGCRRCIDACPAEAIVSIGERVEVNPNLCQGGGICASVCPTGAMRYAYPGPGDTAQRLRQMLRSYREAGGTAPVVLFVADADAAAVAPTPPNLLPVVVEELASVGHELWLAALAWGAAGVLLADGGTMPARARAALEREIGLCHTLLQGLGYDPAALRAVDTGHGPVAARPVAGLPHAADFAATDLKRQLAMLALDHLWLGSRARPETVALGAGASYGRITVDRDRCTLCMSCTSVCPAGALSAGDETPRLVLHEANCVQCGICANACPETAITLQPRLLADPQLRRQGVVLHEDPPFCCVQCGKPFATRRVIDTILAKLAGHAMFQSDRARRRLQMCEDCRVVDAVQDTDAMLASSFNPSDKRS